MNFFSKIMSKKIYLNLWISLVLLLLFSLGTTFFLFAIAPGPLNEFLEILKAVPSLFFLNFIPILFLMLLFFFLTNNSAFSICLISALFAILGLVNRTKISMRQDPLLPTDLTLMRETSAVVNTFDTSLLIKIFSFLAIIILFLLITAVFFRCRKVSTRLRIIGCISTILVIFGANTFLYQSETIYNKYPVQGNIYFQVNHYNSKGLVYCFLYGFNTLKVEKPEGYSPSEYAKLKSAPYSTEKVEEKRPHIIMIMGEAFSDLSINKNLDFTNYTDPLEHFKKLCARKDAISGHIVVPNFGGGTSDTEYDVLTSCPTRYLGNSLPSYNFVRKPFDSIPRNLKKVGYDTLAIHPGYSWFYNRQNVYPYLGFDRFITLDEFDPQTQNKGGYINEKVTIDTIIESFENYSKKSENPLFSFTVTIQNHGPYQDKYLDVSKNFNTDIPLTTAESTMLSNYFYGMIDVDQELGRLVTYIENSNEPIVLVYFGDHLPGFSNGMDFFDILDYDININGTLEERLRVYETPYVIWQNETAKKISHIDQNLKDARLPDNNLISSNYLGSLLLELMDMDHLSPLYEFSNQLRKELPVIATQTFMDGKRNFKEILTTKEQEKVDFLKGWEYYKLFEETVTETKTTSKSSTKEIQ